MLLYQLARRLKSAFGVECLKTKIAIQGPGGARRITYFALDGKHVVVSQQHDDDEVTFAEVERIYRSLGLDPFSRFAN